MKMSNKSLLLGLFCLLAAGCTTTITNLTPSQQVRTPTGLYPFAVAWDTTQQSIRQETIQVCVQVGLEAYPMERTPLVKNRWEILVPIPADRNLINYRYKFDYEYLSIPQRKANSRLSSPYQLKILEK
jgi:hypothetical protein